MWQFKVGDQIITRYTTDKNFTYHVTSLEKSEKIGANYYVIKNDVSGVELRCPRDNINSTCKLVEGNLC